MQISPGIQSTLNDINADWRDVQHNLDLSDKAARGDRRAAKELEQRLAALQRGNRMLEGLNAGDDIHNSVADFQNRLQDRDTGSQYRQWADSEGIETQNQIDNAAAAAAQGQNPSVYMESARKSQQRAEQDRRWADEYAPR
jgi:hypothetical protein